MGFEDVAVNAVDFFSVVIPVLPLLGRQDQRAVLGVIV